MKASRHVEVEFPPELDDYIINFLGDDSISLRRCALVCRAWLVPCQRALFREVTIRTDRQYDKFATAISQSSFLQGCVRILRADRRGHKYSLNYPWINTNFAPTLPSLLTNLHTFEFVEIDERWKPDTFTHLSKLGSVRHLSIVSCSMSPAELYSLICAFQSLEDLNIEHFIDLFASRLQFDSKTFIDRPFPPITRLRVVTEDHSHGSIIDWFLTGERSLNLRDLSIRLDKRNVSKRSHFICHIGESLHHLELQFSPRCANVAGIVASINSIT